MTQEDKDLLLKYLCMALHYGVFVYTDYNTIDCPILLKEISYGGEYYAVGGDYTSLRGIIFNNHPPKPYLRPIASMTEEERDEFESITFPLMKKDWDGNENISCIREIDVLKYMDFILSHHFDIYGLIEKGLAIEVTEENNPYKD